MDFYFENKYLNSQFLCSTLAWSLQTQVALSFLMGQNLTFVAVLGFKKLF